MNENELIETAKSSSKEDALEYGWKAILKGAHMRDVLDDIWELGFKHAQSIQTEDKAGSVLHLMDY